MQIRRALVEDAAALARLHVAAWQVAYRGLVPDSHLQHFAVGRRTKFEKRLAAGAREIYLVEAGEQILGFLTIGPGRAPDLDATQTGEIRAIYVAPDSWRQGIGRRLLQEGERLLRARGHTHAVLWVLEGNRQARGFYEAMGFRLDGGVKTLDLGEPLQTFRYRKALALARRGVDYDRIAPGYNDRFAAEGLQPRVGALQALATELEAQRVLEVGCGTGHWLATLGSAGRELCGLDLSAGMLHQAQKREAPMALARGYARYLPFEPGRFDLVFCVDALHHFADPRGFVGEAFRVLRAGGALAVVGSDPREREDRWYAYHYFPGTCETDLARFPPRDAVTGWLAAEGFEGLGLAPVERIVDHKRGRAVLDDPFLQKDSCSQLALLSDEAYEAGVQRIETDLTEAEGRGETLVFPTIISIQMLTGYKGGC